MHVMVVILMIQKGVNNWNWGLRYACEGGHMEIVELLIQKGATKVVVEDEDDEEDDEDYEDYER